MRPDRSLRVPLERRRIRSENIFYLKISILRYSEVKERERFEREMKYVKIINGFSKGYIYLYIKLKTHLNNYFHLLSRRKVISI